MVQGKAIDITKRYNIVKFDWFNHVVRYIVENVGKTFSAKHRLL